MRRSELFDLSDSDFVIPVHHRLPFQLTQILGEIVGEGIIVINNDDQLVQSPTFFALGSPSAANRAFALSSVSWYSSSGSES